MSRARIVHTAVICLLAPPCAFAQTSIRIHSGKSGEQAGGTMSTVRGGGDMNLDGVPDVLATTYSPFGFRIVWLRGQNGTNTGFVGPAFGEFGKALDGRLGVSSVGDRMVFVLDR